MNNRDVFNKSPRFTTARFHIVSGPASLFERVRFKMKEPRKLKLNADHFQMRANERNVPIEKITKFDPQIWRLMTAEVRADTGKFVSTAWEVIVDGRNWWVVIGLHDTIKTVINTSKMKLGKGDAIICSGLLYDFVARVNRDLMNTEQDQ